MDLDKVLAFLGEHPEAQLAAQLSIAAPAPVSYSTGRLPQRPRVLAGWAPTAAATPVRYRWEPGAGEAGLTDEEAGGPATGLPGRAALAGDLAGAR